jgi:murein L,D-transpeptidase YafK
VCRGGSAKSNALSLASERFGTFVPISYPTAEQRRRGFTGSDIGIHGPDRRFRRLGRLTTWADWTAGCIAVGSDDEIDEIALWVEQHEPSEILIE